MEGNLKVSIVDRQLCTPHFSSIIYVMSKEEARCSQSAISFNVKRKASDKIIPRSNKRAREVIEDTSLTLLVHQAATSTISEEPIAVHVNYFSPRANNSNQKTDKLALKLN